MGFFKNLFGAGANESPRPREVTQEIPVWRLPDAEGQQLFTEVQQRASKHEPTRILLAKLRAGLQALKPQDPSNWIKRYASRFGPMTPGDTNSDVLIENLDHAAAYLVGKERGDNPRVQCLPEAVGVEWFYERAPSQKEYGWVAFKQGSAGYRIYLAWLA